MRFYKVSGDEAVINYVAKNLASLLSANKKVLWLLSGGSAIKVEVAIARRLKGHARLGNLGVSLVDERFGQPDHKDSNWQQLFESGFSLPGAILRPILNGQKLATTAANWEEGLRQELADSDYSLAILGIGPDGHTSGIKPGSPAVGSPNLVEAYEWDDYVRITTTAKALQQLDEAVVYAMGSEKKQQLDNLSKTIDPDKQPAQYLKLINKVTVFSDQI